MTISMHVTFHDMKHSETIEAFARDRAEVLERHPSFVTGCRVRVDAIHPNHQRVAAFRAQVDLVIPNGEIIARGGDGPEAATSPEAAIREAFDSASRQVDERVDRMRAARRR